MIIKGMDTVISNTNKTFSLEIGHDVANEMPQEEKRGEALGNMIHDVSEELENSGSSEESRCYTKQLLQPILILLAFGGCFNFNRIRNNQRGKQHTITRVTSYMFRSFVALIICCIITKFVVAFCYVSDESLFENGLTLTWIVMCSCYFLLHLKADSVSFGNQTKSFRSLDAIIDEFDQLGIKFPEVKVKRRFRRATVFSYFIIVIHMSGLVLRGLFNENTKFLYTSPFEPNILTLSFFYFIETILTIIWISEFTYTIAVCSLLLFAFNSFNSYMKENIKYNSNGKTDINKIRLLHLKLCDLVGEFDNDMRWFFGSTSLLFLGLLCVSLYKLVNMSNIDTYTLLMYLFWMASGLPMLGLVTIFAAFVNERAHSPLDFIYYTDVKGTCLDQATQLNLFLSKLTGTQVGFTTYGLLTITKEFILTIVGVFLTYFAVLYTL